MYASRGLYIIYSNKPYPCSETSLILIASKAAKLFREVCTTMILFFGSITTSILVASQCCANFGNSFSTPNFVDTPKLRIRCAYQPRTFLSLTDTLSFSDDNERLRLPVVGSVIAELEDKFLNRMHAE